MREPIAVGFLGIGTYLPSHIRTNEFWPDTFRPREEKERRGDFLAIERSTGGDSVELPREIVEAMAALGDDPFRGARCRHVLDDGAEPSDMEAQALKRALRAAEVHPDEIDLLIVNSLVQDYIFPSNAPAVQAKCELRNATAWSLDVGCASFQPQLLTAASLIRSGQYRRIALVLSHAGSRVVDYSTPMSTAVGDAAAAVILGPIADGYGIVGHWMRTDGRLRDGVVFAPIVDGRPRKNWEKQVGSGPTCFTSFDLRIGKEAGIRSTAFCREAILGALDHARLTIDDVDLFIGNQSLGWLVDGCRRGLGLPAERAFETFREVGNIGAAALPFNLARAHASGKLRDGAIVAMYSPGAGFTRAGAIYRWIAPRGVVEK